MTFTEDELSYLRSQPLARLATLAESEQPDVMPLAFEFDGNYFWVGGGATVLATRKMRNAAAGRSKVALVIDDLVSLDPFIVRGSGSTARPSHRWSGSAWSAPGTT